MIEAIRIILVDTSHAGNIGASARAMKNMGLSTLVLVRPKAHPVPEAAARAGGAAGLLREARVEPSIDAAIAGCGLIFGTSARPRSANWRVLDPRTAATELQAASASRPAAVLFGGERNGLSNDELACCHALIRIPASPEYESLNLAQAVQIVCYEIMMAGRGPAGGRAPAARPASTEAMAALQRHFDRVLETAGFMHRRNSLQLRTRLQRLLARAVPDEKEVRILRGMLAAIERSWAEPRQ